MESVYQFATHYAIKNNLTLINKYLVKYSTPGSFRTSKGIFLLTESHFFLFEQNKNKLIFMSPWKTVSAISVEESKISLTFLIRKNNINENDENKKFVLWSSQSDLKSVEIKSKIIVLLQRLLSRTEQNNLNIKDLNEPVYYPTPRSPIARFRMWDILTDPSYNLNFSVFTEIHKKMVYSLVFRDQNLQISNFPQSEKILPIYLDILKVAPQVKQLRVPMIPAKKTYDFIIDLLVNNDYLQYLEISGKCQKDFFYIIKAIRDNKNSEVSSLSFVNTQFQINELTLLYDFITNGCNVNALEFHSSISPEAVDYFYSSFLTPVLCEKLAILNLNQSPGVNIEKLFPKITNISMLSLEGCDIELNEVFNCLAQGTSIGLRELNISRCYVKSVPDENLPSFSKSFQKLVINEVSWPSGTLVPFFKFFFSHFKKSQDQQVSNSEVQNQLGPSLYFSNEIAETDEWLSLFDYLGTVDDYRDLIKLGWNGNPVHRKLFNFLKENFRLKELMMSYCFSEESPDSINDLCNFISTTTSFTTLIIRGNEVNHFGKYTVNVIKSLMSHQSLKNIDISFSYGGDDAVAMILPFVQNNMPLQMIDFDCLQIQKVNEFITLMRSLYQRKGQIQISFPTVEFTRLKKDKVVSKDVFDEITHLYKIPLNSESGPTQVSFNELQNLQVNVSDNPPQEETKKKKRKTEISDVDDLPSISPSQILTKNYCIFKNFNPPDFPCIVSKEMFDDIKKQTRQLKSLNSSPRKENDSTFIIMDSPKDFTNRSTSINNTFNNDNDDERIWPTSQAEIAEARSGLKSNSMNGKNTPESTKSPKSLEPFDLEPTPIKPKQQNDENDENDNEEQMSRQNSKVIKKKVRRTPKPKKQASDEDEEDFDEDNSNNNSNSNNINKSRKSVKRVPKKGKSKANKTKRKPRNSNDSDENDYDNEDNEYGNHDKYIKTPKNVKPLYEHSKQFENEDLSSTPSVSLSESTGDEFVFEDKEVPSKPKKQLSVKRKPTSKKKTPKKKSKKVKKPQSPTKKQSNVQNESDEVNDYENNNENEYNDNLSDGDDGDLNENNIDKNESEGSDEFNDNLNKNFNSRNSGKNQPIQKSKNSGKLYKSQPGKIKKSLIKRDKQNDDNDNELRSQVKNRSIPQNRQSIDDNDYNDNEENENDNNDDGVFRSQIFDDQFPKIDKYDNSSNWQKYDQEFSLNTLFSKIKYNKSE